MGRRPWLVILVAALGATAPAQGLGRKVAVLDCRDIATALAERHGKDDGGRAFSERLPALLVALLQTKDANAEVRVANPARLVLIGAGVDQEAGRAIAQLRAAPREFTLTSTLLALPTGDPVLAKLPAQARGAVQRLDEVAAGAVLRATMAGGGALRNLPETSIVSLLPFELRVPPRAAAPALDRLRVHAELLATAPDTAFVRVGLAVADGGKETQLHVDHAQLEVGQGALFVARDGERAFAVWLRCTAVRDQPPLLKVDPPETKDKR